MSDLVAEAVKALGEQGIRARRTRGATSRSKPGVYVEKYGRGVAVHVVAGKDARKAERTHAGVMRTLQASGWQPWVLIDGHCMAVAAEQAKAALVNGTGQR